MDGMSTRRCGRSIKARQTEQDKTSDIAKTRVGIRFIKPSVFYFAEGVLTSSDGLNWTSHRMIEKAEYNYLSPYMHKNLLSENYRPVRIFICSTLGAKLPYLCSRYHEVEASS
jgi:hypothetical protein